MRGKKISKEKTNLNNLNKNNNINQHIKVLEFDSLGINGNNFNNNNNKVNQKNNMNIKQKIFKQQQFLNNQNHKSTNDIQNNKNILTPITNFNEEKNNKNDLKKQNNKKIEEKPSNNKINNNNNNKINNNNKNNKINNNNKKVQKQPSSNQTKNLYNFNADDVIYEDTYEEINPKDNNPKNKENEQKVINTIKMVSNNRNKYKHTNKIFQEIGRMINNPVLNFLTQKEEIPSSKKNNKNKFDPSKKLSEKLSEKMMKYQKEIEEHYNPKEVQNSEEDIYYNNLQKMIKDEIKKNGNFNFEKLSENDRKLLAQRKLYNKMGNYKNEDYNKENINEKINKEIKREIKKEKFFENSEIIENNEKTYKKYDDTELYENIKKGQKELKESNHLLYNDIEFDDSKQKYYDNLDELEKKIYSDNPDERPTAKDILTNLLNKIEYKNQQLINHNNEIENEINKKIKK